MYNSVFKYLITKGQHRVIAHKLSKVKFTENFSLKELLRVEENTAGKMGWEICNFFIMLAVVIGLVVIGIVYLITARILRWLCCRKGKVESKDKTE